MNAGTFVLILHFLAGAAILLLGRRLFWLFVAVVGFLASFDAVPLLLPGRLEWLTLLVAIAVGGVGTLSGAGRAASAPQPVAFVSASTP